MPGKEGTVVKGLSGAGVTEDSNVVQVDIKNGKISRIRPFYFEWKYKRKTWQIKARGQVFEASGIIAGEIKIIQKKYGPTAVLLQAAVGRDQVPIGAATLTTGGQ